jgi:PAS domain-containing protein
MRVPEPEPHHLLAIFNAAPEAYLVLSPDLRIVLANDCYLHTFGLHREALVGRPFGELFGEGTGTATPPVAAAMQRSAGQLRQSRQPEAWPAGPYQPAGADGPARYGQVLNSPVPDGEGRLQYILHKVTPAPGPAAAEQPGADARPVRARTATEGRTSPRQLQRGLYRDGRGVPLPVPQPRAEEFLGKKREELLGQVMWDVFPEAVGTPGYHAIVQAVQEREKAEVEYLSAVYGRWTFLSAVPSAEGGTLLLLYDRHELHQAQQQLELEHCRLKQAQAIGHIGSFEWSPADDFIYWSDEMYRIHGLEPQSERLGLQRVLSFITPKTRAG